MIDLVEMESWRIIFSGKYIMPYRIVAAHDGFYVADGKKRFSNKPITKSNAVKQRQAIAISESKSTGKPVSKFFKK